MLSARGEAFSKLSYNRGLRTGNYHPVTNPTGRVDIGNAENALLKVPLTKFINAQTDFNPALNLYNEGFTGTQRFCRAFATQINEYFEPKEPLTAEDFTITAGVTALNEAVAFVTCDHDAGDAILLGNEVYGSFVKDMTTRTGSGLEFATFGDVDRFDKDCVTCYEKAYDDATNRGVNIRALVICNPHNPLGQCYTPTALIALANFCQLKNIHLISDEIYALTTYTRPDRPSEKFCSVLAADIDPAFLATNVHVLYGTAKDFGAPGHRIGCLITKSKSFANAVRGGVSRFASPSALTDDITARLFEDRTFIRSFVQDSHASLLKSRLFAEELLREAKIPFWDKGNAGLFIWLNLRQYLPTTSASGDEWAGERLLRQRFIEKGLSLSNGEAYHAEMPGKFRLIHSLDEDTVREGVRRLVEVLGA